MSLTNFPNGITSFGVPVLGGGSIPFTGNYFFVDPANGSDGYSGKSPDRPFATLYRAHDACTAGNNDVVYLIGNGGSSGSARLSTALAQTIDSTATAGTLTWSKNATHLIGITAPTSINQRARIAPPTGTYTQATFGSGNFVVVSAVGCVFSNISVFNGFSTGGDDQICWTDTGGRNYYENMNFNGGGDAASAATTTFRSLLVSGSTGENTFNGCSIGLDTVARGNAATVEMELTGGTPRNRFENCIISTYAKNIGACWVAVGASGLDRYALFRNCMFTNPVLPASAANATAMTVGMIINAAAGGTVHVMNSMFYGAATMSTSALCFSNLPAANAKGGLGVVAS